jgi:hypothetical protein
MQTVRISNAAALYHFGITPVERLLILSYEIKLHEHVI